MGWLVVELNKMMVEEEVIDMVLENLVVGNSNNANHGVVASVSSRYHVQKTARATAEI